MRIISNPPLTNSLYYNHTLNRKHAISLLRRESATTKYSSIRLNIPISNLSRPAISTWQRDPVQSREASGPFWLAEAAQLATETAQHGATSTAARLLFESEFNARS